MKSYFICYGLVGGPWHSRGLRRQLAAAGFKMAATAREADIIIAHSAGCWEIDRDSKPKLVVYVGAPLAKPDFKTFSTSNLSILKGFIANHHPLRYVALSGRNAFYALTQPRRNITVIRRAGSSAIRSFQTAHSILIVNQTDPWPRGPKLQALLDDERWTFLSLTGSHDNIWEEPQKYSEIINHYARLLA